MAKPLRPKRGTTAKNDAFVGLASEITVDTEKHSIRVHDGVTAGGHEILPNCLPKSGGTMTGNVNVPDDFNLTATTNNNRIAFFGGTGYNDGAVFELSGSGREGSNGNFFLSARDGSGTIKSLVGRPDGTLTWSGNPVLTSVGGSLSGALTFSTTAVIQRDVDDAYVQIRSGTTRSKGASLEMGGINRSSNAGGFILRATDGTSNADLKGLPGGTLTWAGNEVERALGYSNGYIRWASGVQICWGKTSTGSNGGANIVFPVPFADLPDVLPVIHGSMSSGGPWTILYQPVSGTEANIWAFGPNGSYAQVGASWTAIGRWK